MATKKTAAKSPAKAAAKKTAPAKAPAVPETPTPAPAAKKAAAKKTAAKQASPKQPATHAEIATRAHQYFVERGHHHGSHVADWLRAEKELNS